MDYGWSDDSGNGISGQAQLKGTNILEKAMVALEYIVPDVLVGG